MSKPKTATIEIDADLKARLTLLASKSGRSFMDLTEGILRTHADQLEYTADQYADDEQRWQRYLETGKAIAFEDIRTKLQSLASEAANKQDIQ